ncbi:type I-E CRISPR-associated protein Cas6/Cse3/CasE [Streptomyces sp. NPDC097619]|uniref:type I-E CRISPR-associated protein Cas6/Cse3/CasE n=1 Tax=Streptomyces sp. NPDC097619 TaxID=3157228 RepID=UPI00331BB80C
MTIHTHDLLSFGLPDPQHAVLTVWRSALALSPRTAAACHDAYRMHQLVETGLGTVTTTGNRHGRTLYAAARAPATTPKHPRQALTAGRPHTLLVQTLSPPDWTTHQNTGLITHATTQTVHQTWTTGDSVEIRTIASPLVTKNNEDKKRMRVPLKHPAQCGAWLHERLTRAGCQLAPHDITIDTPETTHQRGQTLTLRQFHATATLHDPHAFTHLLTKGLGHHRAWGAGLVLARKTAKK